MNVTEEKRRSRREGMVREEKRRGKREEQEKRREKRRAREEKEKRMRVEKEIFWLLLLAASSHPL